MKRRLFFTLLLIFAAVSLYAGQSVKPTENLSANSTAVIDTWTEPVTGMTFVWVPQGSYSMGTPEVKNEKPDTGKKKALARPSVLLTIASYATAFFPAGCVSSKKGIVPEEGLDTSDERPVHPVRVNGFWLGMSEVTQAQWTIIMDNNPSYFKKGDTFPVESISWHDAKAFIEKLNFKSSYTFRLPMEEEWEYAARSGGKSQRYSGGNIIDTYAWFRNNCRRSTHQVCTKAPNGLGLYDMSGNVWEWCEDIYYENQYKRKQLPNPVPEKDPEKLKRRVCRGGCYLNTWPNVRCSNRHFYNADYKFLNMGLRLVREEKR